LGALTVWWKLFALPGARIDAPWAGAAASESLRVKCSERVTSGSTLCRLHAWHVDVLYDLNLSDEIRRATLEEIEGAFETWFDRPLEAVLASPQSTTTEDPRDMDAVCSLGERLSNNILANYVRSVAGNSAAAYVPADDVVVTDGLPGDSSPLMEPSREKMRQVVLPMLQRGTIPFITGFFGRSKSGLLTTFGRGGSDLTAALAGYCLDADEVALYKVEYNKDDEGFLKEWTAGWEGIVHDANKTECIPRITYQVAAELAHFGKSVLHPDTVKPALKKNIDVRVLNSLNHSHPGTTIGESTEQDEQEVVATITKANMSTYERKHKSLEFPPDCEWSVPKEDSTIVALVGSNVMDHKDEVLHRVQDSLTSAGILHAVPTRVNGSAHSVCVVVPAEQSSKTIELLHTAMVASTAA
jgi:aspartokinase